MNIRTIQNDCNKKNYNLIMIVLIIIGANDLGSRYAKKIK